MKNCNLKYFYTSVIIELLLLTIATYAIIIQSKAVAMPGIGIRWIMMIGLYIMLYKSKLWAKVTLIILASLCAFIGIGFTIANISTLPFMNPGMGVSILMGIQIFLLLRIKINEQVK